MREDCPRGLTETPASPNKNEATVSELKTHYFQNTSACSPPDYLTETDIFHPLPTFPEKYSTEEERYLADRIVKILKFLSLTCLYFQNFLQRTCITFDVAESSKSC